MHLFGRVDLASWEYGWRLSTTNIGGTTFLDSRGLAGVDHVHSLESGVDIRFRGPFLTVGHIMQ